MGSNRNRRKGSSQPNRGTSESKVAPSLDLSTVESKTSGEGRASSSVRRVQIAISTEVPDSSNLDNIATPRRTPAGDGALSRNSSDMNDFQDALDELAAEKHAHIAGDTIDPERSFVERMSTPGRRPSSRNSVGSQNLDELAAEKHAHIADDTIDPERTYVERIRSPRRGHSSDASRTPSAHPQTLDELAAEKHAHIAADTVDPERTYMERIKSPRRIDDSQSQTLDDLVGIKHARIADDTVDPEHTYVERMRSPRRAEDNCETLYEFGQAKHAHIDSEAASPTGLVPRASTPMADFESSQQNHDRSDVAAAFKGVILQQGGTTHSTAEKDAVRHALRSSSNGTTPIEDSSSPTTSALKKQGSSSPNNNNKGWATLGYYAAVGVVGAAIVARLLTH